MLWLSAVLFMLSLFLFVRTWEGSDVQTHWLAEPTCPCIVICMHMKLELGDIGVASVELFGASLKHDVACY
jgi:hypothetical protein